MGLQHFRISRPDCGRHRGCLCRQLDACRRAPSRRHRAHGGGAYVTAQPIARYWYADMLATRRGAEDVEAAKGMLKESVAASDKIGLALYARVARRRLAQIA
jgi:hypothetical protein